MYPICITCGTQFAEMAEVPSRCPICDDERQYVGLEGQRWTTLEELRRNYRTKVEVEEENLFSFSIEPKFGIGQRAFLVRTEAGNVLWDCISLFDDAALDHIQSVGGVSAISISHPHYYTCTVEWARQFGNVDIYLHEDDALWVMRPDRLIRYWGGETVELPGRLQLIRCGGHFKGATVLHWPRGAGGAGALLSGDTLQVGPDRKYVSFMYSYPNFIPLNAETVTRVCKAVEPYQFDRIYGAFPGMTIASEGKDVVRRSGERYLRAIAPNPG